MARRGVATIWEGYEGEDGDQQATDAEVFGSFFEAPASAETVNGQWDKATEADGIINSFLEEEVHNEILLGCEAPDPADPQDEAD